MQEVEQELTIGQQLHQAETAIHNGRVALSELVVCEPVDEIAVAQTRLGIAEARATRNALRRKLEVQRVQRATYAGGWISY